MNGCSRPAHQSLYRQRGATLVFAGVSLVALIAAVVAALDISNLYFTQRDLQRQANMAAVDAVRVVSGCTAEDTLDIISQAEAEARASIVRNGGMEVLLDNGAFAVGEVLSGIDNMGDPGMRDFTPVADITDGTNAALVRLQRSSPTSFASVFSANPTGDLYAEAVARNVNYAGIAVGSRLAEAEPEILNSLLPGLFNVGGLTAVGYDGLINTRVTVAGLMAAAGADSVEAFLDLNLVELADATLTAAGQNSGILADIPAGLESLGADGVEAGTFLVIPVNLPQMQLENVEFSAGEFLVSLAQAGVADPDGGSVINLDSIINIPLVASASVDLRILQGPQLKIGRPGKDSSGNYFTQARTSQIALTVDLAAVDPPLLPPAFELDLDFSVASGTIGLDAVECAKAATHKHSVYVTTRSEVGAIEAGLQLAGLPVLAPAPTSLGSSSEDMLPPFEVFDHDPSQYPQVQAGSASELGGALDGLLGGLLDVSVLDPLTDVLDELLEALGVRVGTADAMLTSVIINQPELVRTTRRR